MRAAIRTRLRLNPAGTALAVLLAPADRADVGVAASAQVRGGITAIAAGRRALVVVDDAQWLDVLSGGRAMLGTGAAWYEREHNGLGVPFPAPSERFERLEETLQICRQMWGDDDGPYEGRHYQLAETLCRPKTIQ